MLLIVQNFKKIVVLIAVLFYSINCLSQVLQTAEKKQNDISIFIDLIYSKDSIQQRHYLNYISANWKDEFKVMVLELAYLNSSTDLGKRLMDIINEKAEVSLGYSVNAWYKNLWLYAEKTLEHYDYFKAELYRTIDPRFERYFTGRQRTSEIRFDEIRWGGVVQDGIPPLREPEMISIDEALYLADDDIVFGVVVNGDFRAYPKRILAWHELFTATIGGEPVTGVYCTLCGTVILYKSTKDEVKYKLGTSGFLFRSNKLMYDQKTQSLWSTVWGKPVVGPLVNKGIQLDYLSVVTTTWGAWKERNPATTVLSVNTGHQRNYEEGAAYRDYFANDEMMFAVPTIENENILNKQSILGIRLQDDSTANPVALSVKFLKKNPLYHYKIGTTNLLILTDKTGANRVYTIGNRSFKKYKASDNYTADNQGNKWMLHENYLINGNGDTLKRFHTYNAFWFGWQAAYPNTLLVK